MHTIHSLTVFSITNDCIFVLGLVNQKNNIRSAEKTIPKDFTYYLYVFGALVASPNCLSRYMSVLCVERVGTSKGVV